MTENEFELQILRLQEVYGKNKYPEERKNVFWNKFRKIGNRAFTDAVTNFIANNDRSPMIKEFESALAGELNEIRAQKSMEVERQKREQNLCKKCGGAGQYSEYEAGSDGRTARSAWFRIVHRKCDCTERDRVPGKTQGSLFGKEMA